MTTRKDVKAAVRAVNSTRAELAAAADVVSAAGPCSLEAGRLKYAAYVAARCRHDAAWTVYNQARKAYRAERAERTRKETSAALLAALDSIQREAEQEAENMEARAELENRPATWTARRLSAGLVMVANNGRAAS